MGIYSSTSCHEDTNIKNEIDFINDLGKLLVIFTLQKKEENI